MKRKKNPQPTKEQALHFPSLSGKSSKIVYPCILKINIYLNMYFLLHLYEMYQLFKMCFFPSSEFVLFMAPREERACFVILTCGSNLHISMVILENLEKQDISYRTHQSVDKLGFLAVGSSERGRFQTVLLQFAPFFIISLRREKTTGRHPSEYCIPRDAPFWLTGSGADCFGEGRKGFPLLKADLGTDRAAITSDLRHQQQGD